MLKRGKLLTLAAAAMGVTLMQSPASAATVQAVETYLLRGTGSTTHQSDAMYKDGTGLPSCLPGKSFQMQVTWHVRNVTRTTVYVDKLVVRYWAPNTRKSVSLGGGVLVAGGQQLWNAGTTEHLRIAPGNNITRTHSIRKTASFNGLRFERWGNIGNYGREASPCGGPTKFTNFAHPSR
ncbi:hypothetical protein [Rhizohabitans arisaemae]|uniref:hypothetical protein n=1 Tax=Rhizohabitans arisaemae TaxID=2720610 RepID=UPI0024B158EC|nr:hypothetical protein [Rhizohabitans arisaemae]